VTPPLDTNKDLLFTLGRLSQNEGVNAVAVMNDIVKSSQGSYSYISKFTNGIHSKRQSKPKKSSEPALESAAKVQKALLNFNSNVQG